MRPSKVFQIAEIVTSAAPEPVTLSAESAGKSIDTVKIKGEGNDLVLDTSSFYKPTEAGAYPIVLPTYEIVCSKYPDADVAPAVKAFLTVGDDRRPEGLGGGRLHSGPRHVQGQADRRHQRDLVVDRPAMTLKPDPTAVGSSTTRDEPTADRGYSRHVEQSRRSRSRAALQGSTGGATRIFYSIALAAGATIIGAIALMGLFLLIRAVPSLAADNANFITSSEFVTTDENEPAIRHRGSLPGHRSQFDLRSSDCGTDRHRHRHVPDQLRTARLAGRCRILVDLLAAVPSIVFGLWGIFVLAPSWSRSRRSSTTT